MEMFAPYLSLRPCNLGAPCQRRAKACIKPSNSGSDKAIIRVEREASPPVTREESLAVLTMELPRSMVPMGSGRKNALVGNAEEKTTSDVLKNESILLDLLSRLFTDRVLPSAIPTSPGVLTRRSTLPVCMCLVFCNLR